MRNARAFAQSVYLLLSAVMMVSIANATEPTVSVDRDDVQVADPFQLTISLLVADETEVQFPAIPEKLGMFDVLSHRDAFDIPVAEGRSWTRTIELETLDSGSLEVPSLSMVVDGELKVTQPIAVTVQSLLDGGSDPLKFRALKPAEVIEFKRTFWQRNWLPASIIAVVLGLLGLALGVWRWYSARTNPERWAYQQIDWLADSGEFKRGNLTTVLPQAADILRAYMQRRFDIAATRQTTEEFLRSIQFAPSIDGAVKKEMEEFLRHIDSIKFAHLVPASTELHETLQRVRTLVQRCGELSDNGNKEFAPGGPHAQGDASHVVVR